MESLLIWGLALMALALLLFVAELFVPTAGALGVTAGVIAIAGVVCLFRYETVWGLSSLLALLVLGPAFAAFGLKIWPTTPLGRRIIGAPSDEELEQQRVEEEAERRRQASLVGREGVVLTDLRPVGVVEVGGVRYDALSETVYVPAGAKVRITLVEGPRVKVRQLT